MIKILMTLIVFNYFSALAGVESVNLMQEIQAISCPSDSGDLYIEEKDRFLLFNKKKFESIEFLYDAFLSRAKDGEVGFIHRLRKDEFIFVKGQIIDMKESHCKQVESRKVCRLSDRVLDWSPTKIIFNGQAFIVKNYGVYPNDGSFFISENKSLQEAVVIIDFGGKFTLVAGDYLKLKCHYLQAH